MTDIPTLELRITSLSEERKFHVSVQFKAPGSTLASKHVEVQLDPEELTSSLAYDGRRLADRFIPDGDLRHVWRQSLDHVRDRYSRTYCRVRLHVPAALQHFRWECLINPVDNAALAFNENRVLARYLDNSNPQPLPPLPSRAELKALLVAAEPKGLETYGLKPFGAEQKIADIRKRLDAIPCKVVGGRDPETPHATLSSIIAALRDGPQILVVIAHGKKEVQKQGWLYLEKDTGQVPIVSGEEFANAIKNTPSEKRPLLVVLAACDGAGDGYGDTLQAVGPQLIDAGVSAVIAFQGKIAMTSVDLLLTTLFRELLHDGAIDRALAAARLGVKDVDGWWQAVLWTCREDCRLWWEAQLNPLMTPSSTENKVLDLGNNYQIGDLIMTPSSTENKVLDLGNNYQIGDLKIDNIVAGDYHVHHHYPSDPSNPAPQSVTPLHLPFPKSVSEFVGRAKDIEYAVAALRSPARHVVIHGMGGLGKTQLAYAVAQQVEAEFPDGWIRLEMQGTQGAERKTLMHALTGIINAFDLEASPPQDKSHLERLCKRHLADKQVLIFADDVSDKMIIEELYNLLPARCGLIVASRERIAINSNADLDLGVLPLTDAEVMLRQRLPGIGENAATLAQLCGCLPLALKVSIGYLDYNQYNPTEVQMYFEHLRKERMEYLSDVDKPDDPMASVQASLALSFKKLPDVARKILVQASIFVGSFDRITACAVIRPDNGVYREIDRLYKRSLLEFDGQRFKLHDLVREFALSERSQAMTDTEVQALSQRHAEYYAEMAKEIEAAWERDSQEALRMFDVDRAQIEAAWRWANDPKNPSIDRDRLSIYIGRCLTDIALCRYSAGELEKFYSATLGAAQRMHDESIGDFRIGALNMLARVASIKGDFSAARALLKQAEGYSEGDPYKRVMLWENAILIAIDEQDYGEAARLAVQALATADALSAFPKLERLFIRLHQGIALFGLGDLISAEIAYREALTAGQEAPDLEAMAQANLAELLLARGEGALARAAINQVSEAVSLPPESAGEYLRIRAEIELVEGNISDARKSLCQAEEKQDMLGLPKNARARILLEETKRKLALA